MNFYIQNGNSIPFLINEAKCRKELCPLEFCRIQPNIRIRCYIHSVAEDPETPTECSSYHLRLYAYGSARQCSLILDFFILGSNSFQLLFIDAALGLDNWSLVHRIFRQLLELEREDCALANENTNIERMPPAVKLKTTKKLRWTVLMDVHNFVVVENVRKFVASLASTNSKVQMIGRITSIKFVCLALFIKFFSQISSN